MALLENAVALLFMFYCIVFYCLHIVLFALCTDYENCKVPADDTSAMSDMIHQRLLETYAVPFNCMSEKFLHYPRVGYDWALQKWKSLW